MSIFQATIELRLSPNDQMLNIAHYEFVGSIPPIADLQEATDYISLSYESAFKASMNTNVVFEGVTWRQVDIGNLPSLFQVPTTGTWAGTDGGDKMPSQLAMIMNWKAATAYPRSARSYIGGFTEIGNTAGGTPSPALVAGAYACAIALENFTVSIFFTVVNRVAVTYGGVPRVVITQNAVSAFPTKEIWFSQRRRRLGVGS